MDVEPLGDLHQQAVPGCGAINAVEWERLGVGNADAGQSLRLLVKSPDADGDAESVAVVGHQVGHQAQRRGDPISGGEVLVLGGGAAAR